MNKLVGIRVWRVVLERAIFFLFGFEVIVAQWLVAILAVLLGFMGAPVSAKYKIRNRPRNKE